MTVLTGTEKKDKQINKSVHVPSCSSKSEGDN